MASLDRIRQNFVRRTLQTCPQYHGNLADGRQHNVESNNNHETAPTTTGSPWECVVCSARNAASPAATTCAACKRPRVPAWTIFPSGCGLQVGMYITVSGDVLADVEKEDLFAEVFRASQQKRRSAIHGIVVAVDYICLLYTSPSPRDRG